MLNNKDHRKKKDWNSSKASGTFAKRNALPRKDSTTDDEGEPYNPFQQTDEDHEIVADYEDDNWGVDVNA